MIAKDGSIKMPIVITCGNKTIADGTLDSTTGEINVRTVQDAEVNAMVGKWLEDNGIIERQKT